jgi:acyl transferase domain-containing protein
VHGTPTPDRGVSGPSSSDDERSSLPGCFNLPRRLGKLKDLSKFDAGFFGVSPKQANLMDPQQRLLLEVVYEAILDSGTRPSRPSSTSLCN